jgi:hypothetical protein
LATDPHEGGIDLHGTKDLLPSKEGYTPPRKFLFASYAIKVNFNRGFPYFVYKGEGTKGSLRQDALTEFQKLEPIAMAGYSIYIYHVPEKSTGTETAAK